jgi:hypothetical protein
LDLHKVRIAESSLDLHKVQSDKNHLQKRSDLQADGDVCLIPVLQQTVQTEYTLQLAETEQCSDIEEVWFQRTSLDAQDTGSSDKSRMEKGFAEHRHMCRALNLEILG